jgi:hypothetical protein
MDNRSQLDAREKLEQLLLISGSGRNCGKTSLACKVINSIASVNEVTALKISPHFHELSAKQLLLYKSEHVRIYQENDISSNKDSSRMLKAGAKYVYYMQCEDKYILESWDILSQLMPYGTPLVCESGSLASIFKPGLHILVEGRNPDKMKRSYLKNRAYSDLIVHFDGNNFTLDISDILCQENKWKLKEKEDGQSRRRA